MLLTSILHHGIDIGNMITRLFSFGSHFDQINGSFKGVII